MSNIERRVGKLEASLQQDKASTMTKAMENNILCGVELEEKLTEYGPVFEKVAGSLDPGGS